MKLSTKSRYGLRAIIEVARCYGGAPAKRKDIAASQNLSDSYLENILIVLKNSKLVETTRGMKGGYVLSRNPSQVTVLDVIDSLEGTLNLIECVDAPTVCNKSENCATRTVWKELSDSWKSVLSKITLQELLEREDSSNALNYSI